MNARSTLFVVPAQSGRRGWRFAPTSGRPSSIGRGFHRNGGSRRRAHRALAGLLLLAACGKQQDLQPVTGRALPPQPLTARATPTVDQLLIKPAIANPERVDELLTKSQERLDDRFDLPPP